MKTSRHSIIAASVATAISLSGCGGGGTQPPPQPLEPAAGLTPSTATTVYATDAADTLAELLPDGTRAFAPLTAGVNRQFGAAQNLSSSLSDFHVGEIRSDGANGFRITYVGEDGETSTVTMTEADFGASPSSPNEYYKMDETGRNTGSGPTRTGSTEPPGPRDRPNSHIWTRMA